MATTPQGEEPGFESDVNELPEDIDCGSPETLEDRQPEDDEESGDIEDVQEEAAEERKEGATSRG